MVAIAFNFYFPSRVLSGGRTGLAPQPSRTPSVLGREAAILVLVGSGLWIRIRHAIRPVSARTLDTQQCPKLWEDGALLVLFVLD